MADQWLRNGALAIFCIPFLPVFFSVKAGIKEVSQLEQAA
jgi:hypothetical protein